MRSMLFRQASVYRGLNHEEGHLQTITVPEGTPVGQGMHLRFDNGQFLLIYGDYTVNLMHAKVVNMREYAVEITGFRQHRQGWEPIYVVLTMPGNGWGPDA